MDRDSESRIEELAREKLDGKSYTKIREELRASGMEEEEIGRLIRLADERVLKETLEQGERQRSPSYYRWGLFLAVSGLILSILYNAGLIWPRLPAWVAYSPFLAGILLMFYARMKQRKKSAAASRDLGPIRRRRPYQ